MPAARYNYEEIILSGRPVFFLEGEDYKELPEDFRQRWQEAVKRRGLKLATWTVLEPRGIMLQAYLPTHERPLRPAGPATTKITKKSNRGLFCTRNGCDNKLSANEQKYRECKEHR
jgi:hypothetical protein